MAINLYARVKVKRSERKDEEATFKLSDFREALTREISQLTLGELSSESILKPLKLAVEAVLREAKRKIKGYIPKVEVEFSSQIPVGAGLGSSASLASATIAAVSHLVGLSLSKDRIYELTFIPERLIHFNPSGIDQATVIYGGVIFFRRSLKPEKLDVKAMLPIVVGDTGVRRLTGPLVQSLSGKLKRSLTARSFLDEAEKLALTAVKALRTGDLSLLGSLMDRNQELLAKLEVSHESLEKLIWAAKNAGALGAKLTGAGGGGCMIALTRPEDQAKVAEAIRKAGGKPYLVNVDHEGLKVWSREDSPSPCKSEFL